MAAEWRDFARHQASIITRTYSAYMPPERGHVVLKEGLERAEHAQAMARLHEQVGAADNTDQLSVVVEGLLARGLDPEQAGTCAKDILAGRCEDLEGRSGEVKRSP